MKQINKANIVTFLILLAVVTLAAAATYYLLFVRTNVSHDAPLTKALGTEESQLGFTDMEGNKLTLEDYFGNFLVVTSWASWCPQCANDLPELSKLSNEYKDKGVVFLAVNRAENVSTANRFLESIQSTDDLNIILDPADRFFVAHEGYAMPETILYDKSGGVLVHQRGELRAEELKEELNKLLDK